MRSTQWNNVKTNVRTNIDICGNHLLMTENQWLKRGYIPISEEAGKILWANQFCQGSFRYLFEDEVVLKSIADAVKKKKTEKTILAEFYEKRFGRVD